MNLYLKIILGDWENASRDKRELRVAMELGYDIVVIASTKKIIKYLKIKLKNLMLLEYQQEALEKGKSKNI